MSSDELTQPLETRLATLEQENARLRAELDACQRSLTLPTQSGKIENTSAVLQAEVAEYRRQRQEWQEQAIIAREQEKAAQDRVTELEERNRMLESRDSPGNTRRERLLEATATATNALLTVENLDEAVNKALQIIGESLDADRVNVIENFERPFERSFPYWRILYEWDSPGTVPQISHSDAAQGNYEEIQEIYGLLQQGQAISYSLEEAPEPFRSGQAAIGVKTTHLVPIFVEGKLWGVVGLDDCREAKYRSSAELAAIKIAANCVGSAIQRDRIQRAREQAERQVLLEREQAAQERAAELARANNALQHTVAALANRRDLNGFIGEVLHTIAREFDSPLVEYWQNLSLDTVEVDTWIYANQLLSLEQGDEHPSRGGIRLPEELINFADVCRQPLIADEPMPAYSLASGQIICPTDWYAARGVSRHFNFPLQAGNSTVGSISVWLPVDRQITEDCLRLGQTLSHQTALAIQLTQLAEEAKQAALAKLNEVIAREQEKAAVEHAAELAKANDALGNAIAGLARLDNLDLFLAEMLKASLEISGAHSGAVCLIEGDFVRHAVLFDKEGWVPPEIQAEQGTLLVPFTPELREMAQRILESEDAWVVRPDEPIHPPSFQAFHREQGNRTIRLAPMRISDRLLGWLGLGFAEENPPLGKSFGLLQVLAEQMTMAVEMLRLSDDARKTAVAREQEKAAQNRAAELAKANEVLRRTAAQLVGQQDLNHFLHSVLLEVAQEIGAVNNVIFLYDRQSSTHLMQYAVYDGQVINLETDPRFEIWKTPIPEECNEAWRIIQSRGYIWAELEIDNTHGDDLCDFSVPWHRMMQHRVVMCVLLQVGDKPLGYLGLGFRESIQLAAERIELVQALANQAALAIQLTQLAEEAKQAALAKLNEVIAREEEKAAQQQAAELAKANEELRQRDRLLSTVAQITKDLLEAEDIDTAIPAALQAVGEVALMSRVLLILERQDPSTQRLKHCVEHEWTAPGISDHAAVGMAVMDNENFQVLIQPLYAGRSIWRMIEDLPDVTRSQFEKLDIKSTGVVPIFIEGRYNGCVAFDDCFIPRHWSQQEIDALTAAAESIGAALHRKLLVDRLIAERVRTQQERATELAKGNTLLRNSLSRLSTNPDLKDVLGHLLVEVTRYAGASVGHIFTYDAAQNTLTMSVRCRNEQAFWTPAEDEPIIFRSPISVETTPVFTHLCAQPRLFTLNRDEFEGRMWHTVLEWFHAKGYQATSCCVLMVGDRPFGLLAIAFPKQIALRPVDEELILALAQQIALVIQLTTLVEADKQAMIACEREKAAQEQASELAKANQSLQRSLNRLTDDSDLDSFLGHILVEITSQVGADTGHIFLHDAQTSMLELRQGVLNGKPYQTASDQDAEIFRTPFPANVSPAFNHHCQQRIIEFINCEDLGELAWPGGLDWLQQQNYRQIAGLALMAGDQPIGLLGLAFRNKPTLKPEERGLIHALAHQATLAIQLTRLAEQAKESALFEERNRLAGEIHDTLAQAFTGISIQLGVAKWLVQHDPVAVDQILDRVNQLAQTGLAEARRSVWTLYPADEAYGDLANQLSHCVEQMTSGTSIQVDVQILGTPCSLPPMVGKNLLRIGQEAITNALKHAQATTLQIHLTYTDQSIRLCIQDDGRGFLPNIDRSGFGLIGMSDRAERIGGQLTINSQPGQGTAICIQVPLR